MPPCTIFIRVLTLFWLAVHLGCNAPDAVAGRTIHVLFQNAAGVAAGGAVYVAGVRVGTIGDSAVEKGRAKVSVRLAYKFRDAVEAGTIFLAATDPNNQSAKCLVGYTANVSPEPSQPTTLFHGASTRLELVQLVGPRRAKELLGDAVRELFDGLIDQLMAK